MDATLICPICSQPVVADAPQDLCPECLMKSGFATRTVKEISDSKSDLPLPSPGQLSSLFPQLEIIELIGRGGMGAVYKARQRHLNRLVALKVLSPERQNDPSFAERFKREAGALATLNHPHIVTLYDFGEVSQHYFLLMEFVEGPTLRQRLQKGRFLTAGTLTVIPQICQALQCAHEQGIVHRDIKPENILLDSVGQVKISDFGLAKLMDSKPENFSLTSVHQAVGTPHYMAPEQIENPPAVDHRADIYSLGVVFYEMLTGELPLGRFPPPSQKARTDERLDEVVLRALEKDPERRYPKASRLQSDVEAIAATPQRTSSSAAGRSRDNFRRRKKHVVRGALAFTGLISLLWLVIFFGHKDPELTGRPREDLAAWWSGEGNARDRTGLHNGRAENITFPQGIVGRAFHLNGSNAFVTIPHSPSLCPTNLTVVAWVKFDTLKSPHAGLPGQQIIVFKANSRQPHSGSFTGYNLVMNVDHFSFVIGSPAGRLVFADSLTVPQAGVWYHLAGTYDQFSGDLRLYVNGVAEGSGHADFPLDCGTRPLFIGTTGEWWDGKLEGTVDEIAVYSRVLTDIDIQADYIAAKGDPARPYPFEPPAPVRTTSITNGGSESGALPRTGQMALWSGDGKGNDLIGNHTATLDNVSFAERGDSQVFVFNGSNTTLRVPASRTLDVGLGDGLTVAAWIAPSSADLQAIFEWNLNDGVYGGTRQIGTHLGISGNAEYRLLAGIVDTAGVDHWMASMPGVIVTNCFQQVAMTYDKAAGIGILYRNGSIVARMNLGTFTPQTSFDFFVGCRPSGVFTGIWFQGQMDQIAIYNRALTSAEVQASYFARRY